MTRTPVNPRELGRYDENDPEDREFLDRVTAAYVLEDGTIEFHVPGFVLFAPADPDAFSEALWETLATLAEMSGDLPTRRRAGERQAA